MTDSFYDHQQIEPKWQAFWESERLFQGAHQQKITQPDDKQYILFAFAYPSGSGLHVGHAESKTALDIMVRHLRMQGKNVFFPVGWDAFGLPAENYAIKTGVHPTETTREAINTFRRQIKRLGVSYDWENELATSHPAYYRWTQWIFLKLFTAGLAYQAEGMVNWCPSCQTVLANEQVVEGHCERCDTSVIQKKLKQWYFKITDYQDELIAGLERVDWPKATKLQQENWIGKKQGINIQYQVVDAGGVETGQEVVCFTTRPDTNFGATFVVLAPEHDLVSKILAGEDGIKGVESNVAGKIQEYFDKSQKKTELERQQDGRNKSGVFTGLYALNQLTGKKMPIWVSDFVLGGFGTGAVVGVPGHDGRDFEFVQYVNQNYPKMAIDVIRVVLGADGDESEIVAIDQVQEEEGVMVNSEFLNGLDIHLATQKMMDHLEEKGWGQRVTTYKLRDWLISRQRYWGTPIPIIYDPEGNPHPVSDESLPWELPTDVDFKPTGESPLTSSVEFQERTEKYAAQNFADLIAQKGWSPEGQGWRPEYDTMDTFVDSSWYYLRYPDARNTQAFASSDQLTKWLPVDLYMIGPEHIVLHLLYSRFFTKFLRDQGYLNFDEPFMKMRHQGMILGPDGKKMSKSKGNVINPDEVIEKFGADTLRIYEMFMGPLEVDKAWNTRAVIGIYKFLQRVYRLVMSEAEGTGRVVGEGVGVEAGGEATQVNPVRRKLHQVIRKITTDIPALKFNTSISSMMELINLWEAKPHQLQHQELVSFVKLLAPFAPFLAEELYQQLTGAEGKKAEGAVAESKTLESKKTSVHQQKWPEWDDDIAAEDEVTLAVQVNGKLRAEITVPADQVQDQADILEQAKAHPKIEVWLTGKTLQKEIYIPGKIVSLVVG